MSDIGIQCPDCRGYDILVEPGHFTEDYLIGGVPINTWIATTNYCQHEGCRFEWTDFDEATAEFPNAIPAEYQEG